jgi:hypothetical protein
MAPAHARAARRGGARGLARRPVQLPERQQRKHAGPATAAARERDEAAPGYVRHTGRWQSAQRRPAAAPAREISFVPESSAPGAPVKKADQSAFAADRRLQRCLGRSHRRFVAYGIVGIAGQLAKAQRDELVM